MKKMLMLALALLMLIMSCAYAEVPCEMKVVKCTEWVSLRAEPDSSAQRFAEVPLGATVYGFYGSNGDFTQCSYEGAVGYILTDYLQVTAEGNTNRPMPQGEADREISLANGCVRIWRDYEDDSEILYVGRYDAQNQLMWRTCTQTLGTTELDGTEAFVNLQAARPALMLYNSYYALSALDLETGEEIWNLSNTEVSLGGSIIYAVAGDGTMYIGGHYGPDPVAISAEGKVLWQAETDDNYFYWMSNITIISDGIAVVYENGGNPVLVCYDMQGKLVGHEPYSAQ